MYEVLLEMPAAPPAAAAIESTIRIFCAPSGVPVVVVETGLGADRRHRAHRVEEVSEQEREHQQRCRHDAGALEAVEQVELAEQGEVRLGEHLVGPLGHVEVPALRGRIAEAAGPTSANFCTMPAMIVVATMPIRIAPGTPRAYSVIISSRPMLNTRTGQPARLPPMPSWTGGAPMPRRADEAGVDQADERDEQADAHRDRGLELPRHGVEHGLAEAGQHQHQDDQALEHDQAHRVGPRHLRRDRERDERVEPQACGQRQREVGDDAHQDRQQARHQRGHGGDRREARARLAAAAEELAVHVGDVGQG